MQGTIRLSEAVYNALIISSDEFAGTFPEGELQSDGWYEVAVADDVISRLYRIDEDPEQAARQLLGWVPFPRMQ